MTQREQVEGFLRNLKSGEVKYSEDKISLSKMAMQGIDPCSYCNNCKTCGYTCGLMNCLPWYRYFQYRWRRLRKGMLGR